MVAVSSTPGGYRARSGRVIGRPCQGHAAEHANRMVLVLLLRTCTVSKTSLTTSSLRPPPAPAIQTQHLLSCSLFCLVLSCFPAGRGAGRAAAHRHNQRDGRCRVHPKPVGRARDGRGRGAHDGGVPVVGFQAAARAAARQPARRDELSAGALARAVDQRRGIRPRAPGVLACRCACVSVCLRATGLRDCRCLCSCCI
eukprot:200696-Chlamydomonas_euryale.AAC.3